MASVSPEVYLNPTLHVRFSCTYVSVEHMATVSRCVVVVVSHVQDVCVCFQQ